MFTGDIPEVYGSVTGSVQEGNQKCTGRSPESTGGLPECTGWLPECTGGLLGGLPTLYYNNTVRVIYL